MHTNLYFCLNWLYAYIATAGHYFSVSLISSCKLPLHVRISQSSFKALQPMWHTHFKTEVLHLNVVLLVKILLV